MVKFAHISDIHLGGWRQKPMQDLNFQSFRNAVDICIKQKLDFILISGDLFDSAYPPIEILKETFGEFRRLKEAKLQCYIIAGSHDYSVSGKTFLEVLETAGFCRNVAEFEEIGSEIIINPIIHGGSIAIYGYPGKKSGLEIEDLRRVRLNESPGMFRIFMLHTTIDKAKGTLPIDSIETDLLPKADYYALGHLHIDFQYQNFVYPGPLFPNNFQELEDLEHGRFYIVDTEKDSINKIELKIKEVISFDIQVNDALLATEKIISELDKKDLEDKIVLLRIRGELNRGKNSDIKFLRIEEFAKKKKAFFLLKNTHDLITKDVEVLVEIKDINNIETESVNLYSEQNPSGFNRIIVSLMDALSVEKQEGETSESFTRRITEETKKILKY